jgi:predicted Zn-dependent protease
VVARISGAPESLALRLAPYVDLAAGKVAVTSDDPRSLGAAVVGDKPDAARVWQLAVARQLLAEGQADRAVRLLGDAVKADPASIPLRLAMVEALASSGQGRDALTWLESLPPHALKADPAPMALLRARVLVSLEQRDEAQRTLEGLARTTPLPPEGHDLLGQLYERRGEWQKAAHEYRAAR